LALLLTVLAVGAWAALRWQDLQPRVRGLLAESRLGSRDSAGADAARRSEPLEVDRHTVLGEVPAVPAASAAAGIEPAPSPQARPAQQDMPEAAALQEAAAPHAEAVEPQVAAGASPAMASADPVEVPVPAAAATEQTAESDPAVVVVPIANRQDLQAHGRLARTTKKILVQRGDTLMNLAARQYGYATYTVLDVVRAANPGIQDVNRIIAGSEIVFPDPGPSARVVNSGDGVSVLVATTPVLMQAQEIQRLVGSRYRLPADLEPIALGDGRNLYRVSLRKVTDQTQALQIAESLGSILRDPS
jgi:phage tail protein X